MKKKVYDSEILEPRSPNEIWAIENELFERLWYYVHRDFCRDKRYLLKMTPEIRKGALKGQKRIEKKFKGERLYPLDSYELGMLEGKLSAIRWVLGYDWDMLDT